MNVPPKYVLSTASLNSVMENLNWKFSCTDICRIRPRKYYYMERHLLSKGNL